MQERTPFLSFDRKAWRKYRQDTPLTVTEQDLDALRGFNDPVSLQEVEEVYLPLCRLLNMYIEAGQSLYEVTSQFLGHPEPRVPYIIGVSGSVAVGKSTTSRVLQALLSRWPSHPKVVWVTTDGFLLTNEQLEQKGLMARKGFPESYDLRALIRCLTDIKSGEPSVRIPQYSHEIYNIIPDQYQVIEQPDIVILEGLNVLQVGAHSEQKFPNTFVSDFFDFSIYVDADIELIESWYMERFMQFRHAAANRPDLFMHRFAEMSEVEARKLAQYYWHDINAANYYENIQPYQYRARCILQKGVDHAVHNILLRKI